MTMMNPSEDTPVSPRIQVPVLVERARRALEEGRPAEAVEALRQAKALAPFRDDVRELMVEALQARAVSAAKGPQPLRIHTRGRLFGDTPIEPPAEIEMIRLRPEQSHEPPSEEPMEAPPVEEEFFRPRGAILDRDRPASAVEAEANPFFEAEAGPQPERITPLPTGRAADPDAGAGDSPDRLVASATPSPAVGEPRPWVSDRASTTRRRVTPLGVPSYTARRPRNRAKIALGIGGVLCFASLGMAVFLYFSGRVTPSVESIAAPSAEDLSARQKERLRMELIDKADQYMKQSKFTLAVEQLEKLDPGPEREKLLADAYARQAESYYRSKQHEDARKFYELALKHDPTNSGYAFEIGWMNYYMARQAQEKDREKAASRFKEAERRFSEALHLDENNTQALYGLAKVEIARSNRPGAADYFKRLIQVNPEAREAREAKETLAQWRVAN